jgi:hypothetical protein
MENDGIFYGHLEYFTAIWYILRPFGIFFPVLLHCVKKNLATLVFLLTCRHACKMGFRKVMCVGGKKGGHQGHVIEKILPFSCTHRCMAFENATFVLTFCVQNSFLKASVITLKLGIIIFGNERKLLSNHKTTYLDICRQMFRKKYLMKSSFEPVSFEQICSN